MLGPAPSASGDPSTWYAAVAAPHRKLSGNAYRSLIGVQCAECGRAARANLAPLPVGAPPEKHDRAGSSVVHHRSGAAVIDLPHSALRTPPGVRSPWHA